MAERGNRSAAIREMEPEIGAPKPGLHSLPAEMHVRVLVHLPSIRDFGRACCVCRAWRADGSPVEQALRQRIEVRDGAVPTALPGAGTMLQRMCWSELLRDARLASGVTMSTGQLTSAAVDADGHLCVWGELESPTEPIAEPIFRYKNPTILQTARVERVSIGMDHILALADAGEVLSFGEGLYGRLGHGGSVIQRVPKVIEALRGTRVVAIAAGGRHSMVLTDEGAVLSFGMGYSGQLGHGDEGLKLVPKVIAGLQAFRMYG